MLSKIPEFISNDLRILVGRFTYGNPQCLLWDESERITIGQFCSIAVDVTIFGGGEHRTDWVTTFPLRIAFGDPLGGKDGHPASKGETIIGDDVWLGYRAVILSGVSVGSGAVVGACAVVTSDVPPYSIVAGNPARIVKKRFSNKQIEELLSIRWWDWSMEEIHKLTPMLCSSDIDGIIKYARQREIQIYNQLRV